MISQINEFLWGNLLIILIPLVGVYFTYRCGFVQFRFFKPAIKYAFRGNDSGEGEISAFSSLCTMLGATIGTGNIVGVATAVCTGGVGALFWMEISALLGMATKYAEGLLAVKFREKAGGEFFGGPFYYIEKGLGRRYKWLAKSFCVFAVLAGLFGIGTLTQINSINEALQSFFDPEKSHTLLSIGDNQYTATTVVGGVVVTLLTALLILGGIKRIAKFSEMLIPFMSVVYVILTLTIIICNIKGLPLALTKMVKSAFTTTAVTGSAVGISVKQALSVGFSKGVFSNEAGLGSSAIGAAATKTREPVEGGLVTMISAFIDTTVLCTLSGLAVVLANPTATGGNGIAVTVAAWNKGLPFGGMLTSFLLDFSLVFFAFATIPGWSYYSECCLNYLSNDSKKLRKAFRIIYILVVAVGPYLSFDFVWQIADCLNGLMALPNLFALVLLGGVVSRETSQYFKRNEISKKAI